MVGFWVPGVQRYKIPPAADVKMLSQLMKEVPWELNCEVTPEEVLRVSCTFIAKILISIRVNS